MFLFLILLMPLLLTAYCFYKKNNKFLFVIALGVFVSSILCAVNFFFMFSHRVIPYDFGSNLWYFIKKTGVLPLAVMYSLFFVFSKDSVGEKIEYYIPLMGGFYSILIPYTVLSLTATDSYYSFDLFVKPVLYTFMICGSGLNLKAFYDYLKDKKILFVIISALLSILCMLLPSFIEVMEVLSYSVGLKLLMIIMLILCSVLPVAVTFMKKRQ